MRRRHSPAEVNLLKRWERIAKKWIAPDWVEEHHVSRKRHPLDCGNPRCGVCHHDKILGHTPTNQERRSEDRLREQREEV